MEFVMFAPQTSLLECAFLGDAAARDKFSLIIAEGVEPKLEASMYLDGEDNENELKQVLGDTQGAYNLTPDDVMVTGKNGMLIAGPNSRKHEALLIQYLQVRLFNPLFIRFNSIQLDSIRFNSILIRFYSVVIRAELWWATAARSEHVPTCVLHADFYPGR